MNRRICALILCCAVLLGLSGCGKDAKVIRAIDAIGTVTMKSGEKIEKAEGLLAQLEEEEKAAVTNRDILIQARAEYDRQSALIQKAAEAIDAIGTVTIQQTPAIFAAREAYHAAQPYDTENLLGSRLQTLEAAEEVLQQLIGEADLLFSEIIMLGEAEEYLQIETIAAPYVWNLPAGDLKLRLGSAVMTALCSEAQKRYENGDAVGAMELLDRCEEYVGVCEEDARSQYAALKEQYLADLAKKVPANGTILERTYNAGRNTFTVTAGSFDTCVKLELVSDPEKYVVFYVRANETAKINLLNGIYRIKYAAGPVWFGREALFGPDATYLAVEETMELAGYTTSSHVYWHTVSCILHTGYGEELGLQNMAPEEF